MISSPTLTEINEHRQALLDIEGLLIQLQKPSLFEMGPGEAKILARALTEHSLEKLNKVSEWMEEMSDRAEATEKAA